MNSSHKPEKPTTNDPLSMNLDWEHNLPVPVVVNEVGGSQSKLIRDWTLLPFDALALVLQVLEQGAAKRGRDNWKTIPSFEHIQHLLEHAIASHQCSHDESLAIEHLTHVVCRALFALQVLYEEHHEARETVYTVRHPDASDVNYHPDDAGSDIRQNLQYGEILNNLNQPRYK